MEVPVARSLNVQSDSRRSKACSLSFARNYGYGLSYHELILIVDVPFVAVQVGVQEIVGG